MNPYLFYRFEKKCAHGDVQCLVKTLFQNHSNAHFVSFLSTQKEVND